jgi:putative transposase
VQLIISNDQAGMEAASNAVFTGIPWPRCRFHPKQKSLSYVPGVGMRIEVAEDVRSIFNVPDRITAQQYLEKAVSKNTEIATKLADWMEVNLP